MKEIYLHMLKPWGGLKKDEIHVFGESKGLRVIAGGLAEEVPAPKIKKPKVETAMNNPVAETANAQPDITFHAEVPVREDGKTLDVTSFTGIEQPVVQPEVKIDHRRGRRS